MTARHVASLSSSLLARGSRAESQGFVLNGTPSPAAKDGESVSQAERESVASQSPGSSDEGQGLLEQQIRRIVRDFLAAGRSEKGTPPTGREVNLVAAAVDGEPIGGRLDEPDDVSIESLVGRLVRHFSQVDPLQGSVPSPGTKGDRREFAEPDVANSHSDLAVQVGAGTSRLALDDPFAALASRVESVIQRHLESGVPAKAMCSAEAGPDCNKGEERSADLPVSSAACESGVQQLGAKPNNGRGSQKAASGSFASETQESIHEGQAGGQDADGGAQRVVIALRQGDLLLAEETFGQLCGLAKPEVERLLYRSNGEDLAAACRVIEADQLQFVSIFVMTRKAKSAANSVDLVNLKQTIEFFDGLSRSHADRLQIAWRSRMVS